ncbi:BF3164 family lipoprotein [Parabacteroides sp. Marseille-P3160]|uniref:BF3164 family lipoprotein n=1 Tax=Parabacteroides sp. Marseille-P3160 TaxID=1917887 RepID=UPI0009B9F4A7|nr:BF3164 family lipoprotein [Parabacteroides sp. Marseille-P3160]
MKIKLKLLLFLLLYFITSCKDRPISSITELFNAPQSIKHQTVEISNFSTNVLNPVASLVHGNLLILLDVQSPISFSAVDLKQGRYIKSWGKRGEGPGEIIGIMDFYSNYTEKGINYWDAMLKRLYFCSYDSLLFESEIINVNLIENIKNKELFNHFFPNVLQIRESLFLGIGDSGDKRFSIINTEQNTITQTGDYPLQDKISGVQPFVKASAYNGFIRFNAGKKRIAYISRNSEMFEIFDISTTELKLFYGNYTTIPKYQQISSNMGITVKTDYYTNGRNICVSTTDDYIFILGKPHNVNIDKENVQKATDTVNQVFMFDWDGRPIAHYLLDCNLTSISATEDSKRLYGILNEEEARIVYFDL